MRRSLSLGESLERPNCMSSRGSWSCSGTGKPWTKEHELGNQTCSQELGTETPCAEPPPLSQAIVQADGHRNEGLEIISCFSGGYLRCWQVTLLKDIQTYISATYKALLKFVKPNDKRIALYLSLKSGCEESSMFYCELHLVEFKKE